MSEDPPHPENAEPPHQQRRQGWGWLQWGLVGLLVILGACFVIPWMREANEKANEMWAITYSRQIIIALKSYASDHGGSYPDGVTANDALRELFKMGYFEDETVFSSPYSPYVGDNKVGTAPEYSQALQARENHWAMTKGLTDESSGNIPLLFENPAVASWPPKWDSRLVGVAQPGRIWKGGRIVVCRNDGSANLEHLAKEELPLVTLEHNSQGKNLFDLAGPHVILDVAR